ncbi:hypothetical protein CIK77_06625 [Microbacterium sp. JB110]|nr:hypothetical protein CIK77_06625 [Microbacterium sp. JB110]SJM69428.1 PROBABLE CONSERVED TRANSMEMBRANE PROTEIN [Frigoribacterium sp. JB110]
MVAAAAGLVWLGMVIAISFLEAPLKFRAPGITVPLGLGIGRLVFRALNIAEAVLALIVLAGLALAAWPAAGFWLLAAILILVVQLAVVRPVLQRRSNRVLAGETSGKRSRMHRVYPALEAFKVVALLAGGLLLLATL